MSSELKHILRTHCDHEVLSDQACLRDMITEMRRLADYLALDFRSALTSADLERGPYLTFAASVPQAVHGLRNRLSLSQEIHHDARIGVPDPYN